MLIFVPVDMSTHVSTVPDVIVQVTIVVHVNITIHVVTSLLFHVLTKVASGDKLDLPLHRPSYGVGEISQSEQISTGIIILFHPPTRGPTHVNTMS